jgi:hypothetical protein
MGGNHERPLTAREKAKIKSLDLIVRLLSVDVLIALLHLLVTCAAVFGWVHTHGGEP